MELRSVLCSPTLFIFQLSVKAGSSITKSHISQTMSYLRTLGLKKGLLINFPYPDADEPDFEEVEL